MFISIGGCPDAGLVELHGILMKCLFHCSVWSSVVISHIAIQRGYVVNFCLLYCSSKILNEYCVKINLKICSKKLKILLKKFFSSMMLVESARAKQFKQFSLSTVCRICAMFSIK